jgi:hypothetical protein
MCIFMLLIFPVLGSNPVVELGKCSTTDLNSQPLNLCFNASLKSDLYIDMKVAAPLNVLLTSAFTPLICSYCSWDPRYLPINPVIQEGEAGGSLESRSSRSHWQHSKILSQITIILICFYF